MVVSVLWKTARKTSIPPFRPPLILAVCMLLLMLTFVLVILQYLKLRKDATPMSQVLLELWQSLNSFVLTPESDSILYLLISVSCIITILRNSWRILAAPWKLLLQLARKLITAVKRVLPKNKQAQLQQLEQLITEITEVASNAEHRLHQIYQSPGGREKATFYVDDAGKSDEQS